MKNLIFIFLLIGSAIIFFGCQQDSALPTELSQSELGVTSLAKETVAYFNGTSVSILPPIDPGKMVTLPSGRVLIRDFVIQTDDDLNDTRVDGIVTWIVHMDIYPDGSDKRWGSGELIIPNVGRWDMTYKGWFTPTDGVTYEVDGHGKGDLQGLKAHWTYLKPPGQDFFTVQGYIIEH